MLVMAGFGQNQEMVFVVMCRQLPRSQYLVVLAMALEVIMVNAPCHSEQIAKCYSEKQCL